MVNTPSLPVVAPHGDDDRDLRSFRRYILWHSKIEIAAAIHHTSRLRTSTTIAATQTVNIAPVPAAATCAATASVPVVGHVTPDPAVYTASAPANEYTVSAPVNEYVASARVIEYVTPAPVTTLLVPPVPAVYTVQVCHVRTIQGTQTSESLGTVPVRHTAPAELVDKVELGPPSSAVSTPPVFVTAPMVEAAPVVAEYVQPAKRRCRLIRPSRTILCTSSQ